MVLTAFEVYKTENRTLHSNKTVKRNGNYRLFYFVLWANFAGGMF